MPDEPARPTRNNWPSFLSATVRCFYRGSTEPVAEGKVIAYCPVPTLVIEQPDGTRFHHAIDLPLEVMEWRRVHE
jgi:hypothetical protein